MDNKSNGAKGRFISRNQALDEPEPSARLPANLEVPMQAYPYAITPHEPTQKQLWLASFTSLLARLSPEEAIRKPIAPSICVTNAGVIRNT